MIFYFSGTGNSAYAASQISRKTGDQICSINERIKSHRFYSGKELETAVFVVPTYAWENTKTGGTVDPEIGFSVRSEGIFCNDLW